MSSTAIETAFHHHSTTTKVSRSATIRDLLYSIPATSSKPSATLHPQLVTKMPPFRPANETHGTYTPCLHPRHPAYAAIYTLPLCPYCRIKLHVSELRDTDRDIFSRGGVRPWWDHIINCRMYGIEDAMQAMAWSQRVHGGSRSRKSYVDIDEDGKDWSHRHAKKRLHNFLDDLKILADREREWNCAHPGRIAESEGLAIRTLNAYEKVNRTRPVEMLEHYEHLFARERGRDMQIAAHENYPLDVMEPKDANRWFHTTFEQREFIRRSDVPSVKEDKYVEMPRKPKTQVVKHVAFEEKVYVRTEADIDVLRTMARGTPAYECRELRDGPRDRKVSRRDVSRYPPFLLDGTCIVDTSGRRGDWETWEEYVKALEEEGVWLDDMSRKERVHRSLSTVIKSIGVLTVVGVFLFAFGQL